MGDPHGMYPAHFTGSLEAGSADMAWQVLGQQQSPRKHLLLRLSFLAQAGVWRQLFGALGHWTCVWSPCLSCSGPAGTRRPHGLGSNYVPCPAEPQHSRLPSLLSSRWLLRRALTETLDQPLRLDSTSTFVAAISLQPWEGGRAGTANHILQVRETEEIQEAKRLVRAGGQTPGDV